MPGQIVFAAADADAGIVVVAVDDLVCKEGRFFLVWLLARRVDARDWSGPVRRASCWLWVLDDVCRGFLGSDALVLEVNNPTDRWSLCSGLATILRRTTAWLTDANPTAGRLLLLVVVVVVNDEGVYLEANRFFPIGNTLARGC